MDKILGAFNIYSRAEHFYFMRANFSFQAAG